MCKYYQGVFESYTCNTHWKMTEISTYLALQNKILMDSYFLSAHQVEEEIPNWSQLKVKTEPDYREKYEKSDDVNIGFSVTNHHYIQNEPLQCTAMKLKQEENFDLTGFKEEDPLAPNISGNKDNEKLKEEPSFNLTLNHEVDPLAPDICGNENISKSQLYTWDNRKEVDVDVTHEDKYLSYEDTKYNIDVNDHKIEYTVNHNEFSHSIRCESSSEPSCIGNNKKEPEIGQRNTSLYETKYRGYIKQSINNSKCLNTSSNVIDTYQCSVCSKSFLKSKNLRYHIYAAHKKTFRHKCNQCNKMFSLNTSLQTHVHSVHKGIKNFECNECQKRFYEIANIKQHINFIHKKIKKFECSHCSKRFSLKSHLLSHIQSVHLAIKSFQCSECCKTFSRLCHLKDHTDRVHKKIKKYECQVCHKMFFQSGGLKKHMNELHNRTINCVCKDCKKIFFRISNLQQHINFVHRKVKRFECNICDKLFSHKGDLRRHINSIHLLLKRVR